MLEEGKIMKEGKRYLLSKYGSYDFDRLQLLGLITETKGLSVVKAEEGAQALEAEEELILKTSIGYAFPGIRPGALQALMVAAHKYLMLHLLGYLISQRSIDGTRFVTKPSAQILTLRKALKRHLPRRQVVAFIFDLQKLADGVQESYLDELLRVARIEDAEHIENKTTAYIKSFKGDLR